MRRWMTKVSRWMSPSDKSASSVVAIAIPAAAHVDQAINGGNNPTRVVETNGNAEVVQNGNVEVIQGNEKAQITV